MLIAGDIGGTKTDLAIFSTEAGPLAPIVEARVPSADYSSLQDIVKEFLASTKFSVDRACFAVAGPVIAGRVKTTNLPWVVDEGSLAEELNLNVKSVHVINDLEAVARAVPILRPSDIVTINAGEPIAHGPIAVIAPGTGLGESFLTWDSSEYVAHSSEGGHSDFAPSDERQVHLLEYMFKKMDHVSFEQVCSGIGLRTLSAFLRDAEGMVEEPEIARQIANAKDPSFVIIDQGIDPTSRSKLCAATMDLFVSILAGEAGNLAVKFLATGGVYLAGGASVHALEVIKKPEFMRRFKNKGRFTGLLERIPVHVVVSPAGLAGAAARGLEA
jgi:glucokinase